MNEAVVFAVAITGSAGKKIRGRKPHILVDIEGFLMAAIVHPANVHDRDGGVLQMSSLFGLLSLCTKAVR